MRAILLLCCLLQAGSVLPSAILQGYNLLQSNPLALHDEGASAGAVFAPSPATLPAAAAEWDCTLEPLGPSLIASGAALQELLLRTLVSAPHTPDPLRRAAFTGGALLHALERARSTGVLQVALAQCAVETARTEGADLALAFRQRIAALRASDPASLAALAQDFGTHYHTSLTLGGAGLVHEALTPAEHHALRAQGPAALLARAQEALLRATAGNASASTSAAFVPLLPPAAQALQWRAALAKASAAGSLAVAHRGLAPLPALLTPARFPADPHIGLKQRALADFLSYRLCSLTPRCAFLNPAPVVAYFQAECPSPWLRYGPAEGALLLPVDGSADYPTPGTAPPGQAPWAADASGTLTDPGHTHAVTLDLAIPMDGIAGGGDSGGLLTGSDFSMAGELDPSTVADALPLAQAITCYLPASSGDPAPPPTFALGSLHSFDYATVAACPSGWEADATFPFGYVIVPAQGSANTHPCSGARPVGSGESITHTHTATVRAQTVSGVSLYSTGGGGFAAVEPWDSGTAAATVSSAPSLPYLPLLLCKNVGSPDTQPPPLGLLSFAVSCSQLNPGGVGAAAWAPAPLFGGGYLLLTAPAEGGGQVFGGGSALGHSNCQGNGAGQQHTHTGEPDVTEEPSCGPISLFTACGGIFEPSCNKYNPGCGGFAVSGYSNGAASALPPLIQLQQCFPLPSPSPTSSHTPSSSITPSFSSTPSISPSVSSTPLPLAPKRPAAASAATIAGAVCGAALVVGGCLCYARARARRGAAQEDASAYSLHDGYTRLSPAAGFAAASSQDIIVFQRPPSAPPAAQGQEGHSQVECSVCMERPVDRVFECGHVICRFCELLLPSKVCHVCRAPVGSSRPLFLG